MIDWPNALIGFVLGLIPTGIGWWSERRKRRQQAAYEWVAFARGLEQLIWQPGLTAVKLHNATVDRPLDMWRSVAGRTGFVALERLEHALENWEHLREQGPVDPGQEKRWLDELTTAHTAFANWVRAESSSQYNRLLRSEHQHHAISHPLQTTWSTFLSARSRRRARRRRVKKKS